jgi:anthranilate/para-aminobenzoate synthase component II
MTPQGPDIGRGVFAGLPTPFEATRYHSLVVRQAGLPACLEVSAETEDGLVMGLRHKPHPVEGVQFHPESILTVSGKALLGNFLARLGPKAPGADGTPARDPRWFE